MSGAVARTPFERVIPGLRTCWDRGRLAPRWLLPLACSGWLTWLGLLLPAGSALRVVLVFGFVLVCPGLAVTLLLPVREAAMRWVLSVALSMSLALVLNTVLTIVSDDSLPLRLAVLASITTVASVIAGVGGAAVPTPGEADP